MGYSHILVPTDLSAESRRAFAPAAELARSDRARVSLLHVVSDVPLIPHGAPLAPPLEGLSVAKQSELARETLEALRGEFAGAKSVDVLVQAAADPATAIARLAKERHCDLIVVSTHGRTGFRRLILGSVAEAVLRHAEVPVLCIPQRS